MSINMSTKARKMDDYMITCTLYEIHDQEYLHIFLYPFYGQRHGH